MTALRLYLRAGIIVVAFGPLALLACPTATDRPGCRTLVRTSSAIRTDAGQCEAVCPDPAPYRGYVEACFDVTPRRGGDAAVPVWECQNMFGDCGQASLFMNSLDGGLEAGPTP